MIDLKEIKKITGSEEEEAHCHPKNSRVNLMKKDIHLIHLDETTWKTNNQVDHQDKS